MQVLQPKHGGKLIIKDNRFADLPKHACVYMIKDQVTGLNYISHTDNMNKTAIDTVSKIKRGYRGVYRLLQEHEYVIIILDDCKYLKPAQRKQIALERVIEHNTYKPNGLNSLSSKQNATAS